MSLIFRLILVRVLMVNFRSSVNKIYIRKVYRVFLELKLVTYWVLKIIAGFIVFLLLNYNRYLYFRVGLTMYYGEVLIIALVFVIIIWVLWGVNSFRIIIRHLLPRGIIGVLKLFIPVLELIGIRIRPLTLGVRLATNISCGHVVSLIFRYFVFRVREVLVFRIVFVLVGLYMIEFLVCLIQAYVFWSLLYIYSMEIEI